MPRQPQPNEPFEEPPREEIPGISRGRVAAWSRRTPTRLGLAGMHHVVLHTIGRKSGNEHKVALPFWVDEQGHRVSWRPSPGRRPPAWYLNIADKEANPEVRVKAQGGEFWADPQVLDGNDYDQTWAALVEDREYYTNCRTAHRPARIPLVRLVELRPV